MLPNGPMDYFTEEKEGRVVKRIKANRPKALCFDFMKLKEMFGVDLETEVIAEGSEEDEI